MTPKSLVGKQTGHVGMYANDPMDDRKVNMKYEIVTKTNSSVFEDFVYLYIPESARDDINNSDELLIAYGKQYWLYRPFWDTLSAEDQKEATKAGVPN